MTDRQAGSSEGQRLLAGALVAGLVGAAGVLGTGVATADTSLIVGGANGPYIPWEAITNMVGRGFYPDDARQIVNYPAGLAWGRLPDKILPSEFSSLGLSTPTVGESVDVGATNLNADIRNTADVARVVGSSEGTMVLNEAQARLATDPGAPPPDRLSFTFFGPPMMSTPFSHSFLSNLTPGFHVPLIDQKVLPPVDSQYDTTVVVGQYDPVADFPDRPDNLVSVLNSLVALGYIHTQTAFASPADIPPQNITTTVNSRGATFTTYFLPSQHLPLTQPLRDLGVPANLVDQLDAVVKPMVEAGYSRNDYPGAPATGIDPATRANFENLLQQAAAYLPPGIN